MTLNGTTALVTGAARGIGRAIAVALLEQGARVALTDIDELELERTHRALAGAGETRAYPLDVTDLDAFHDVVARAEADLGPLGVLVNNAGIMAVGRFVDTEARLDDRMIDINLRGVLHGARAALRAFEAHGRGHLVNLASSAGKLGARHGTTYCATKHAVVGLSEALADEYADSPIRISYVMPGLVRTDLTAGAPAMRYPPPLTPEQVATSVVQALRTGRVDVYVPGFAAATSVLPALLPRPIMRVLRRWFGVDRVFVVDDEARKAYRARIAR